MAPPALRIAEAQREVAAIRLQTQAWIQRLAAAQRDGSGADLRQLEESFAAVRAAFGRLEQGAS